jgi:hypothetical protein
LVECVIRGIADARRMKEVEGGRREERRRRELRVD